MKMKELDQWVCWRSEERGGRRTKVPYSPASGSRARCDDPATWGTFSETRDAVREGHYDGLGFVFTAEDPFCGVDLDGCVDPETGEVESWAMEVVEELGSYTEFSPSGTGLHVIVRAVLPEGGNRRGGIELYERGRFFTVTGRRLSGTSHLIEERQQQISTLHARLFPPREKEQPVKDAAAANGLTDDEILRRAMGAANGGKFARLWTGDRSGYASDSEADLALCSMLAFWTGPDEERISSLVAKSGLAREKWNREDYRRRTIVRALEGMTSFYEPGTNGAELSRNGHKGAEAATSNRSVDRSVLPEAPTLPADAMPASCQQLIREAEKALGCAPELVALPMLAVLSSAIGTTRVVEVKGGWHEWAALFLAVVASPGAMKTPAAKIAKKPAFERQRSLGKFYAEEKEDWKREVREWEVEKRDAQKAGEPAPEEPAPPAMGRCVAGDTTVEALVSILEDNPRGLLVYRDELAGWVRSMDQYKGGKGSDRQNWLNLWNTDEVVVDRKSRLGEPVILATPFVSLFGGIQPAMLGVLGGGMEDGMMDRFLFAYPAPRYARFSYEEVSPQAWERYAALYDGLADLTLATDEYGDPNPKPLKLSHEAKKLFARVADSLSAEMLQPGFPQRLEGVWSKLRGYLARLSLVLAVCRCVEGGVREERVEVGDVEAASKLLGYFKTHARRVYAEISVPDPLEILGADLKELLEDNGGRMEATATEIYRRLEEAGCEALPARPKELGAAIRALSGRSSMLRVSFGWRGKEKVARLELVSDLAENSVGRVGRVGSVGKNHVSTNPTNATNARIESEDQPDTSPAVATNATDARSERSDDGRERFTL
jgi:putative DNA primase/helicase